jgi:excisionase family DNA binding protein
MIGNGQPTIPTVRLEGAVLYNVLDTAQALSIGRTKVYELIRSGALESVRVGRRRLVPAHAIAEYVATLCENHAIQ